MCLELKGNEKNQILMLVFSLNQHNNGSGVPGTGFWVLGSGSGSWVLGAESWVLGPGCWVWCRVHVSV